MPRTEAERSFVRNAVALPNWITAGSLLCGLWAVCAELGAHDAGLAMRLLFVAGLLDFLDGWAARQLNCCSRLGELLDFFVDTIVYLGLVPILCFALAGTPLYILAVFALSGCLRHARQLTQPGQKRQGIPSTFAAFVVPAIWWTLGAGSAHLPRALAIGLILMTIGMQLRFDTSFYDDLKDRLIWR